jgi:integrase
VYRWPIKRTVGSFEEVEMAATAHLTLVVPGNEKCTVQSAPAGLPRRKPNAEYRSREHLAEREVGRLIEAMKGNRWGHRDATMVIIAFRHGLRASELVDLRWEQIDLEHALLQVRRLKNGSPATHPLTGKELRALRRLQREQITKSPFVFTSERGTPFHQAWLSGDGRACWRSCWVRYEDPPAHAAPRLRLQTGR